MATKLTPKSCSCRTCTHRKHTAAGNFAVKNDERAARHAANQVLRARGVDADFHPVGYRSRIG